MGRKRLPEGVKRVKVPLRLPSATLQRIESIGSVTEVIEIAVNEYLEKCDKERKYSVD